MAEIDGTERAWTATGLATAILTAHEAVNWLRDGRTVCYCGAKVGDHPAHVASMLAAARLLADTGLLREPPVVTVEEAPEGDPAMEAVQAWFNRGGC